MRTLSYVCGTNGESIGFEGPVYGETMPALRGRAWSYTTGLLNLTGVTRGTRELTVTVKVTDLAELDRMRLLMDADMANGTPGTLVADDEWQASAYVTKSEPQTITPLYVSTTLTVVLLDGVWRRESTTQYNPSTLASYTDLDYPYDYGHDWSPSLLADTASNPALSPMPCRLTVYGPATAPEITIGDNVYAVDCEVPSGAYLVIDGLNRTIRLTVNNGDLVDHFPDGRRGSGLGGGEYCFQPLPAGKSDVSWVGGFGFDLTVIEERGEPPWST
ncbi:hypothetical protein [Bifidobacterium thermacidophilum]|uniref:Phage tail protein n=1 Tax=Bifidobacterium thermacidophilum subsp. thermacidophilum TaxID=79262 RepID=A0A087E4D3_9BIFI|nr:hypothetical protein [Bifidobacterium thermacidophilum]KFJ02634.1 Phage tail protein [Bifidobacterium thermacidophilum subsp. thermacidophilum]